MTLDERRLRLLLLAAIVLAGAGVWAFVLRGADGPADPALGASVGSTPSVPELPGDPARVRLDGFDEVAVAVDPGGGGALRMFCLLAAYTSGQRELGLMGVTDLQGYSGMAFVYEEDVQNAFYMRNTPTPLSIAWITEDGDVVSITDMEPCGDRDDCPTYPSGGPYRYAIEVFQGDLAALGITDSATVRVGGDCAATSSG